MIFCESVCGDSGFAAAVRRQPCRTTASGLTLAAGGGVGGAFKKTVAGG
ncbi:MAG: hypothetical protein HQL80_11315 [Magnetococcales bacterium]|nr:hypothetical protein [Magnetococcales bacterium]